jgi:hypothetical protein
VSTIADAAGELLAALRTVSDVGEPYGELAQSVRTPGVVLGAPALTWGTGCIDPTEGRWIVYVVTAVSDRAMEELWDLVPRVAAALDAVPSASVIRADPGAFPDGASQLPCYEITVEVNL